MPSQEQLLAAFKSAADSGDEEAAKVFASELASLQQVPQQAEAAHTEVPLMARVGRGYQDVLDRITQGVLNAGEKMGVYGEGMADAATQNANEDIAQYEGDRKAQNGGKDTFDAARLAGNVAMTAPAAAVIPGGGASLVGRAAAGAAQGGVAGALQFDPSNSTSGTLQNVATGAGGGAMLGPTLGFMGDALGGIGRATLGRMRGVKAAPSLTTEAQAIIQREAPNLPQDRMDALLSDVVKEVKRTGSLNREQLARKANLEANNVKPTKSMITRDPTDWTRERNLQKLTQSPEEDLNRVGRDITEVYQGNDRALTDKLGSFSKSLPQTTQEAHGQAVMQSIDDLATATQKDVSKLYEQVRQTKGDQLASDARNLSTALDGLKDNTYAEKLVGSVTNKLKRFGMIDAEGKLTTNTLTVTQAEELRKFVNTLPNDFGKKDIIKAIDQDVLSGMGDDAFGGARKAASERFALLHNPATQRALGTLGELSQGKTAQNFIKQQIIDGADQDVKSLVATIEKLPAFEMQASMDQLRAGVLQHLEKQAINENSNKFSGAAFNKALNALGEDKLQRVFGPDVTRQLRSLARAGIDATYEPPYSAVNHSGSGTYLASMMAKMKPAARYIKATPIISHGIEKAEEVAAQNAAERSLSDALRATPQGELPNSAVMDEIAQLMRASTPVGVNAAGQKRRESTNGR
jgi:hypothetical protein